MFARLAALLVRHRWVVFALLVLVTAAAAIVAPRVRFDFTPQAIFEGQDDLLGYAEEVKDLFGHNDAVLMVILEATSGEDVLAPAALEWLLEISGKLEKLPDASRVISLASLRLPGPPPFFAAQPILKGSPVEEADAERVRGMVERLPLLQGSLVSEDLRVGSIVVFLDPGARDLERTRAVVASASANLAALPPPRGYVHHLSGQPALRADIVDSLAEDQASLLPIAAVLFLVVLGIVFRCLSGTVLPLLAVGMGLCWLVALIVLTNHTFNIISNILPVFLIVIGLANCVHVVSRYGEEAAWTPEDRLAATKRTIATMALACLLTFTTTAIGFLSLLGARSRLMQEVGWQTALGMVFLYITTLAVLGTLLPSFRPPRYLGPSRAGVSLTSRLVSAAGYAVSRRPRAALAVVLLAVIGAVVAARDITVNSFMIETYDEDHPALRALRVVERKLGGLLALDVSLEAEDRDRFLDPVVFGRLRALGRFAARRPGVLSVRSYVDMHEQILAAGAAKPAPPPAGDAGRFRLKQSDRLLRLLGETAGYDAFMSEDGTRSRMMVRVADVGTRRTLEIISALEERLASLLPAGLGVKARLTGDAYLHAICLDRFVRDLLLSFAGASIVIFSVIALILRSLRLGLIAVIPNLTPLVLTLGYMGLSGYDLNVGNTIVFAISLGVAVDHTIHFLARFREEVKVDGDVPQAIRRTLRGAGRAIVLATVLVAGGLCVLLFSEFIPTRRFAELTSVTMLSALLGATLLLPAFLALFYPKSEAKRQDPLEGV